MEVSQGPNVGCSAKGKKIISSYHAYEPFAYTYGKWYVSSYSLLSLSILVSTLLKVKWSLLLNLVIRSYIDSPLRYDAIVLERVLLIICTFVSGLVGHGC
jgi:hypothetical protein